MIKDIKEEPIKAVLYYISQEEYANEALMASIRAECAEYKKQKYQPAIFIWERKVLRSPCIGC